MKRFLINLFLIGVVIVACGSVTITPAEDPTETPTETDTLTPTMTDTPTETPIPTPTLTPSPTATPTPVNPFPSAPLCPSHDNSTFHTLWNAYLGCHYTHEHGTNPFTPEVAAAFPGFDLYALLGGVGIGHTNPSSPMENTMKHGGFKWQVQTSTPHACELGFEGGQVAIDALAMQYHGFGNYALEFEARVHSVAALMRQCKATDPNDKGYVYIVQHVDYGQRLYSYQGLIMPYLDNPLPSFNSGLAPYFTSDCINCGAKFNTRLAKLAANNNVSTTWTSKSPVRVSPSGSPLLMILFRARDLYQVVDQSDQTYPFSFLWMCSTNNGVTYAALSGCRYNNSTTRVHEVQGTIPPEWDNLSGFDTNPTAGRITAEGYVTRFGMLNLSCTGVGPECFPIKLQNAFVGFYSSFLIQVKEDQFKPVGNPERDIYFCGSVVCTETSPGAVSSGWIGAEN